MAINRKNDNDVTILWHDVIVKFFLSCFVSLVKFSYWCTFPVNIITDSGVMIIFLYKELTRNPEIRNILVRVLTNIWRLRRVRDTKLGMYVSTEMLLRAAKCQSHSFYRRLVFNRKNQPPPRLRVKNQLFQKCNFLTTAGF